mgnify:FL=1
MKKPTTAKALKENLKELTSTKSSVKKSKGSLTRKTQTTKGKTSTKINIVQSRKKDLFPHMGIAHKFPYYFEPMPEIQDRLNKAWFDQYYGEERMKDHIRKHKLKSHQYKAYVNYWWLKDQPKR